MTNGSIRVLSKSVRASITHNGELHEVDVPALPGVRSLEQAERQASDWLIAKRNLLSNIPPNRTSVPWRAKIGEYPVGVSLSRSGRSCFFQVSYRSADGEQCLKTFTVGPSDLVTPGDIEVVGRIACAFNAAWLESSRIGVRFDPGIWSEWRAYFQVELTRSDGRASIGDPFGAGVAMIPQPWAQPTWDVEKDPIPLPAEHPVVVTGMPSR